MEFSILLKLGSILWVGLVLLVGLLINGEQMYRWAWYKILEERDWMAQKLDIMFVDTTPKQILWMYGSYLMVLFLLGFFLLLPSAGGGVVVGTLFVLIGWKLPRKIIEILFKRRITKFVVQMVDGLSLVSNALRSGLNVPQAMSLVTEELSNPIAQEFELVLSQNKLGVTLEDALTNLSKRMPHDDIEMFTTSINILKETGGNLAETFDSIAYTIRERIRVESKISAMVAQGVFQGIVVVVMPFALGGILYMVDPERIQPMFTTLPGWVLLTAMMTLQALGGYTIWKIIQVKV